MSSREENVRMTKKLKNITLHVISKSFETIATRTQALNANL